MPQVAIRWRPYPGQITERIIGELATKMPEICAVALSIPEGRQYQPSQIVVEVDQQSHLDVNMPLILIKVIATGSPEQIQRRHEARAQIIEGIRTHMGKNLDRDDGSVWLLLPETSFGML